MPFTALLKLIPSLSRTLLSYRLIESISIAMSAPKIFVTRATGTQGTAVCRYLRKRGVTVHALVRDATDYRAVALKDMGVIIFEGSSEDQGAVERVVVGCTGMFLVLMPNLKVEASEPLQAKLLLGAAKAAGVQHVVFSTSIGAGRLDELGVDPEWSMYTKVVEWKHDAELLVRNGGFAAWTILRPGYFMNNFLFPLVHLMYPELANEHKFVTSMEPTTMLPLIDPNDIGAYVDAALANPEGYNGQVMEFAGEGVTVEHVVETLRDATGKDIKTTYRTLEESRAMAKVNPVIMGQLLSKEMFKLVDMEKVKELGLPLGTFKDFLKREHRLVKQTFDSHSENVIKLF